MSRRRPRGLRPEEQELWQQVAASAAPMHRRKPVVAEPTPPQLPPAPRQPEPLPPFQIGVKSAGITPSHDLAPSVSQQLSQAPLRMDRKSFDKMSRGKLAPEARIDLHGMTVSQAHPALTRFVQTAHARGKRLVLVITGKGRKGDDNHIIPQHPGVLKRQVPQWLTMPPLGSIVLQVTEAHLRHGGTGAYYVYLRRPK